MFVAAASLLSCSGDAAPRQLQVETEGLDPSIAEVAIGVYADADPSAPWSESDIEVLGYARDGDSVVVSMTLGSSEAGDPMFAVVRLAEDAGDWQMNGGLLACQSEPLGISFAFEQEEPASGFVVVLDAKEGAPAHGDLTVPRTAPMVAWAASVDASSPVEYTGDSATGVFCR
jgi:hypothetical protein